MIYTDILISAACHPVSAVFLTLRGAWHLQLNKSLEQPFRSIFRRSRVFHGKQLAEGNL
jgi:hypothetical protein